jgi:hypothetical protein
MPDGTIYAGQYGGGIKVFAAAHDGPSSRVWEAKEYVATMNRQRAYGHDDWQLPSRAKSSVLFNSRAAIGGFDLSGDELDSSYWTEDRAPGTDESTGYTKNFGSGRVEYDYGGNDLPFRPVRVGL